MPKPLNSETAIERGLAFLVESQEADGGFVSFSSASINTFRRLRSWQTTFVPALMMISLSGLDGPKALGVRNKLATFLLAQKDANWSFNYWSRAAPEYTAQAYPNDLDDTFCALAGLYLHDPSLVDAAALAKIVKLLVATETNVGGPYRTWLVPADSQPIWLDVDVAVNSNIAYFLSFVSNRLPRLDSMMGRAIAADSFSSPYYPSEYAFLYYFSRSYKGSQRSRLLRKARRLHAAASTDLDRALCLLTRLRLGDTKNMSGRVKDLLRNQRRDGSWPAAAFYADPVKNGKAYYNGAAALTTAFVLEALQLYSQSNQPAPAKRVQSAGSNHRELRRTVLALAEKQSQGLGRDLRAATRRALGQVAGSSNGPEIIGLAQRFSESLAGPAKKLPAGLTETLGLANLYGWLAYTIYDDFIDEEGKPEMIPVANTALRRSLDNFTEALPANKLFAAFVRRIFDAIDSANAWELADCRFRVRGKELVVGKLPDYGNLAKLAERSIGHALPPMAILAATGISVDGVASRRTLQTFRHYLIARQLNDDAHDWSEDLQNGHITPVVAQVLSGLSVKPGNHDLSKLLTMARRQFWRTTLPEVCLQMRRHVRLSRQNLSRSRLFKPDSFIESLLDGLETSTAETLAQQRGAEDFLTQYKLKEHKKVART